MGYHDEQSRTAASAAFISGQSVYRAQMSKVGVPGADIGWAAEDPTIATGEFGNNHFGDMTNNCRPCPEFPVED